MEAASFFGVDTADLPHWNRSIERAQNAILDEFRWMLKSLRSLKIFHRTWKKDPISAWLHLNRADRSARAAEHARERGAISFLAAGQPGTWEPDEEEQLQQASLVVFRTGNQAGERLDLLWERLRQAFAALAAAGDGRPWVPPNAGQTRRTLKQRLLAAAERILAHIQRRQRWKAEAPDDVPRGVSRGRAPPLLADCAL